MQADWNSYLKTFFVCLGYQFEIKRHGCCVGVVRFACTRALFANGFSGGGERALFEARACGAQVEVADDNSKLQARQPLVGPPFHLS